MNANRCFSLRSLSGCLKSVTQTRTGRRKSNAVRSMVPETLEVRCLLSGVCDTIPTLPSLVSVLDRQVIVQERLRDESLGGPAALVAEGANWAPHSIGAAEANLHLEFRNWYQTDIPLMQQMGVNVIRVYHDFGTDATAFQILDALYLADIKVIVTLDSPQHGVSADLNNISKVVNAYKDHPAVLMWNLGVEWDINGYYGTFGTLAEAAQFTETAAQLIKSLDSNHPVTTAIADPHIPKDYARPTNWYHPLSQVAFPYAEHAHGYMDEIINSVPSIDVWSIQIYRGSSFQDVFQQWASISTEPVLVTEFGADAFDHRVNAENQAMQAQFDAGLWDELSFNLAAERSAGVAVGGLKFSGSDEWWKNGTPGVHTVSTEQNGGQPDGFNDEEWFGVLDINRQPRQVYTSLQDRFVNGQSAVIVNATPIIGVTSQFGASSARFEIDDKVVFQRAGGLDGARGINVAVLDSNTGIRMSEVRSFDTWANSSGGYGGPHTNFQLLINYLNSLPSGAVIALAIADEGGFIQDATGQPWPETIVEQAYLALEALGSTQIRNVGYEGGYAMIVVKGQGVLAEAFSGANVPVSINGQASLNLNLDAGKRPNLNDPGIAAIAAQTLTKGNELCLQVHAIDADEQGLRFSLDSAPAGATIHSTRGMFDWTPSANQAPGTYSVTVRTTDSGTPTRSDTETFVITLVEPPSVTLSVAPASMAETAGTSTVTATLSVVSSLDVTINLTFTGTATNLSDYTRSGTQIVISVGNNTGTVTLTAVNDTLGENNETILVDISSIINGAESGTQQVTATITGNDAPKPTLHPITRFQSTLRPTFTWDALPGAAKFDVWINDVSRGITQYVRNTNVNGTSFTPSSDLPLAVYRAWVRGIAADGTAGMWSTGIEFVTMQAPTITQGQNSTFDRTPTFAWNALPGAAKYELQIRNRNTGATTINQTNITGLNFTPSTPLPDGPYRVWIIGVSAQGVRSFWTAPMDIYISGRTDLLAPVGSTADTTPTFTWRPVDGAVRYELWVTNITLNVRVVNQTNLTALSYTPTTALPKHSYRGWVRAVSSFGEFSPWSIQVDFSIVAAAYVPDSGFAPDDLLLSLAILDSALIESNSPLSTAPRIERSARLFPESASRNSFGNRNEQFSIAPSLLWHRHQADAIPPSKHRSPPAVSHISACAFEFADADMVAIDSVMSESTARDLTLNNFQ